MRFITETGTPPSPRALAFFLRNEQKHRVTNPPGSCRVKFWGVRGSIPTPGPATVYYGGNTSCIEVRADGELLTCEPAAVLPMAQRYFLF